MDLDYPKHEVIKNKKYLRALNEYLDCVDIEFQKIKNSDKFDNYLNNKLYNQACLNQSNEIKKIINDGGLDFGNFTH